MRYFFFRWLGFVWFSVGRFAAAAVAGRDWHVIGATTVDWP